MVFAFAEKIWNFDLPALGYQLVKRAFGDLMASVEMGFGGIDSLIYTDQFGTTTSGSSYQGNVTGLDREGHVESMSYVLFTLTIAGSNRQGASITYYKDAYPAIHSITSLHDGAVIAGSETITTTLEDGSVFVQFRVSPKISCHQSLLEFIGQPCAPLCMPHALVLTGMVSASRHNGSAIAVQVSVAISSMANPPGRFVTSIGWSQ